MGPRGIKGDRGNTGPEGPEGPAGVPSLEVEVPFDPEQTINAPATDVLITGAATGALAAGTYMVWVEFDYYITAANTLGTYGIYVNGVISGTSRDAGTQDPITTEVPRIMLKASVFHIVTVGAGQVIDVRVSLSVGVFSPRRGSIIYQKLS